MRFITKKENEKGAIKYLWEVERNQKKYGIESVFFQYKLQLNPEDNNYVLLPNSKFDGIMKYGICISTQIGCPLTCTTCASSKLPFIANLTSNEINTQITNTLKNNPHVVKSNFGLDIGFTGIGEPLLNYDNVVEAINSYEEIIPPTYFTISTVGIIPMILKLSREQLKFPVRLQVSLHFSTDEKRDEFFPINKKHPIGKVLQAAREFSLRQESVIILNYILIEGVNDSDKDVKKLIRLVKRELIKFVDNDLLWVKLSKFNGGFGNHKSPSHARSEKIKRILETEGINTYLFKSHETNIHAGCGQLALKKIL